MKKVLFLLIGLLILSSTLFASVNKIDKLEERDSKIKLGFNKLNTNADNKTVYKTYLRHKIDMNVLGYDYVLIPSIDGSYEDNNNNDDSTTSKYKVSLLTEHTLVNCSKIGGYFKISKSRDDNNFIESKYKTGVGSFQYLIKTKSFLIKTREGLQYIDTDYSIPNTVDDPSIYGKLGFLIGYYFKENIFIKGKIDYDIGLDESHNLITNVLGIDFLIADNFSIETKYKHTYDDVEIKDMKENQEELTTSFVYSF